MAQGELTPIEATVLVQKVIDLYAAAEAVLLERLGKAIARGITGQHWSEMQILELQRYQRQAQTVLAELAAAATATAGEAVALAANRGAAIAQTAIAQSLQPALTATGGTRDTSAVTRIAAQLEASLTPTPSRIYRAIDDVYRTVIVEANVPGGVTLGVETRRDAAQRALNDFARRGITGFVDRAGRRWEMASYVEMATRSATMNAAIEGHTARLIERGHDLVIVSDVPQECERCRPWEGRILSLTGTVVGAITPDGKKIAGTLDAARAAGLFHPGCRHSMSRYQPGVTRSFGETADPQGDADRQKLRALERAVRAAKRAELVALDEQAAKATRARTRAIQARIRDHVATTSAKRQPQRERITGAR